MPNEITTNLKTNTAALLKEPFYSLLSRNDIDWAGKCLFTPEGRFNGFKNGRQGGNISARPVPSDAETVARAKVEKKRIEKIMIKPTKAEFAELMARLSFHCGHQQMTPEMSQSVLQDKWEDLKDYSLPILKEACKQYRLLPKGNNFMPQSGNLIALIKEEWNALNTALSRIEAIIDGEKDGKG